MTDAPQRVLLAGASGYIGRRVAETLVARGCQVIALTRSEPTASKMQTDSIVADVTDADSLSDALRNTRAHSVISCLASRTGVSEDSWLVDHQANRNLLATCRDLGAEHFVLLSAICVQKPQLAFQHAKLAFENELKNSGIGYSIVRPTAFFKSLSGQVQRVLNNKPFLVFGDGMLTACKPISAEDMAAYLCDCLVDTDKRNRVLPIGGPGPALTAREQGQLLFDAVGKPARFRSVSPRLFKILGWMLALPAWVSRAAATRRELLRIGHYYATESMLVWDPVGDHYDADATPEYGRDTLAAHYQRLVTEGDNDTELGEHKLF
ncbi:MAG: NAD(P)H-binding protein [Pseudomonadota bacterium]